KSKEMDGPAKDNPLKAERQIIRDSYMRPAGRVLLQTVAHIAHSFQTVKNSTPIIRRKQGPFFKVEI
ncbi:MAG: hypothetical protein ABJH57_01925, partial [Cyclobacteriaceae bacterium]